MTREGDEEDQQQHFAKRRAVLEIGRWFVAPIVTVLVLWGSNWIEIVRVTQDSPAHIARNAERLTKVERDLAALQIQIATQLGAMQSDVAVIRSHMTQVLNDHSMLLRVRPNGSYYYDEPEEKKHRKK